MSQSNYSDSEVSSKSPRTQDKKSNATSADFTAKAIYSNLKKKQVRSPSFNNSSDFEDEVCEDIPEMDSASVQLIRFVDNKIELCPEGAEFLKKIKGELGIISVAGPARTGKSLLLNLLTKKNSFQVGNRVQSCTQGVWFTPLLAGGKVLLIIDSEGCKSVDKGANYDAKLFALLILISSVFVYNSRGVIDEQSINQLTLATHLSEMISFSLTDEDNNEEKASQFAPAFVWVLRDFHLSLVDKEENSITPLQYMEDILNMKKFYGRRADQNLKIREKFMSIFQQRSCFTLPRPADNEHELENLEHVELAQLKSKFVKSFNKLEKALVGRCPLKRFGNSHITGLQLVIFLEAVLRSVNSGQVPNFHTAWEEVVRKQYELFLHEAKARYQELRGVTVEKMPYEESELILRLQTAREEALQGLKGFEERKIEHEEWVTEEFDGFFKEDLQFTIETNSTASEAYNVALIERIFKNILNQLNKPNFDVNFEVFESNWMNCMKDFERQAKGPGKIMAVTQFYRKHQHSAYAKFFNSSTENYEKEIKRLRDLQKHYHNELYEEFPNERDEMIQNHVLEI